MVVVAAAVAVVVVTRPVERGRGLGESFPGPRDVSGPGPRHH